MSEKSHSSFTSHIIARKWLSSKIFLLRLGFPSEFSFDSGQHLRFEYNGIQRDYSMISSPSKKTADFIVEKIPGGIVSSFLAASQIGQPVEVKGPYGYFRFRTSSRPSICVATGTGIAPFVSFLRSGFHISLLLHGVNDFMDLYLSEEMRKTTRYIPCVSRKKDESCGTAFFCGRVTEYVKHYLPNGCYNFYLSGAPEMIRDLISIIDYSFPESSVFYESFY